MCLGATPACAQGPLLVVLRELYVVWGAGGSEIKHTQAVYKVRQTPSLMVSGPMFHFVSLLLSVKYFTFSPLRAV